MRCKTLAARVFRALFLGTLVVGTVSCLNPLQHGVMNGDTAGGGGTGATSQAVTVRLGDMSVMTILPDVQSVVDRYDVTLSSAEHDNQTQSDTDSVFTFPAVEVGNWQVVVEGVDEDSGDAVVVTGTADFEVVEGGDNIVSVTLAPTEDGNGAVDVTVTWPAGAIDGIAAAELVPNEAATPIDVSGDVTLDTGGDPESATYVDEELPSGLHRLILSFSRNDAVVARVIEMLHVFDGVTSSASIALTAAQIGTPPGPPTGGSVSYPGANAFTLSWSDDSNTEEGFNVYEGAPDGTPDFVAAANAVSAGSGAGELDWQGTIGDLATYNVTAFNDFGESAPIEIDVSPPLIGDATDVTDTAGNVHSVYAADIDGDGDRDVISASTADDTVEWFENTDGAGTLSSGRLISDAADGPMDVHAADLDGDGHTDVISASKTDNSVTWYRNTDGTGNSWTATDITTGAAGVRSVYAVDLDNDGDLDVLSASNAGGDITWYENRLNQSENDFHGGVDIDSSATNAQSVYAVDLDGDMDVDVLSASFGLDRIAWYENTDGAGNFSGAKDISTGADQTRSVFAADLDGDGDTDVLSASGGDNRIVWYENRLNQSQNDFTGGTEISTTAMGTESVYATDLDGDGDADVLSANFETDEIVWYENTDGAGAFSGGTEISSGADGANDVFAADLDGDGDADVLSASRRDNRVVWYENYSQVDATPPAPVDGLSAEAGGGDITVNWINPSDTDLASLELTWVRAESPATIDFTNEVTNPAVDGAGAYTRTNASPGTYIITVTAFDEQGNVSRARQVRVNRGFQIGDTGPAGGIIFYDDEADGLDNIAGARYLEAAPASTEWDPKEWGGYDMDVNGNDGGVAPELDGIGDGEANTQAIVNALGAGNYAAKLAQDLQYGGYDDWFLPSKSELNLMFVHKEVIGGFSSNPSVYYWSSSEHNSADAWHQTFRDGYQTRRFKNDTNRVRAIRSF